jgi:hypothetical protein
MKLLAVNYRFCRNIMRDLTKVLIIAAIIPNFTFLTFFLLAIFNDYGTLTTSLLDLLRGILTFAIAPIMLITIALTFYKKFKILTSVLRIIAVILNAYFLIGLIWSRHEILTDLALDTFLIYCAYPAANLVVIALTFIKQKEKTEDFY